MCEEDVREVRRELNALSKQVERIAEIMDIETVSD